MKKIIITSFAALCSLFATAQTSHEFSINGGGGLSALNYKLSAGKKSPGGGGEFGVGYTFLFGKTAGIHVGANIALYNANATLDGVDVVTENLTDNEGDRFNMHTTLNSYEESQKATFLNIPLMLQLQANKFYVMAGAKIGLPLSCKYEALNATITNKAYYPAYNNWLTEQEFAGYGKFENVNATGKTKYGISAALALETGAKWNIGKTLAVYTGVYFDYGLNSIAKSDNAFINYNRSNPAEFTVNSALASSEKINVLAVGVKVRVALKK